MSVSSSGRQTSEFWEARFGTPECVQNYHCYAYEYLDDLSFMPLARDLFGDWKFAPSLLAKVTDKLKALGWEGDGEFQILWLPPFAGAGPHDTHGCYALHVKQENDGISWIASPYILPFHRLFQPDEAKYPSPNSQDSMDQVKNSGRRKGMVRWLGDLFRDQPD
ncbi:hypothetical protein [Prosthecobacter sp.]|uniref:hypothetical protein n=1 Tax=Prosthecobacter sp. TaxID=1965333 RepID=UPI0025F455BD|nr:hypothetical protein [Prosthecobacter sp.]